MAGKPQKLDSEQVAQIQLLYKVRVPVSRIATHFMVSVATIRHHTGHGYMEKFDIPTVLEALAA